MVWVGVWVVCPSGLKTLFGFRKCTCCRDVMAGLKMAIYLHPVMPGTPF